MKGIKNISILFLSSTILALLPMLAFGQETKPDSVAVEELKESYDRFTHFRIGTDLAKIAATPLNQDYSTLEFQLATNYSLETDLIGEFAFGNAQVQNQYLDYTNTSVSIRVGADRSFFTPEIVGDRDNAFAGVRYGFAFLNRSDVSYTINDPNYGESMGMIPSKNSIVHWIELTGGFRMEVAQNIFLGWMIRGKTFINPKKIEELTPRHISGYGNAEKQPAFDYNLWLSYGFGKR